VGKLPSWCDSGFSELILPFVKNVKMLGKKERGKKMEIIEGFHIGDCLDLLGRVPRKSVTIVVTDPPFNILNKSNIKFKTRSDMVQDAQFDHFESYEEYLEFTRKWVSLVSGVMKDDSAFYAFYAAQYITDLVRVCEENEMVFGAIITWHKNNPSVKVRKSSWVWSTESILYMTRGTPIFHFLGQNEMHNYIEMPLCSGKERIVDSDGKTLHPTQKPEELIRMFIKISSNPGDVVLDPFGGVATTPVVARDLGRKCISFEKNERYYRAGLTRLNTAGEPLRGILD
jgi:DNA modification methylase